MRSLSASMDAAAQLHLLLCAQQRDLADLLEVVLNGVIQQLIHSSLQVRRVLLRLVAVLISQAQVCIRIALCILHLGQDAVHIQPSIDVDIVQHLNAPLFQEGIQGLQIHPALSRQSLCLLCRQGAFSLRQQFF